jgi:nitrate/nitrite transporter NarK
MEKFAPYYKAISGALIAFLTGILGGLANDGLSASEIIVALIALLTVGGGVFAIPNIQSNYPPDKAPEKA